MHLNLVRLMKTVFSNKILLFIFIIDKILCDKLIANMVTIILCLYPHSLQCDCICSHQEAESISPFLESKWAL